MKPLEYHENIKRGSLDFPLDYHLIAQGHPRYLMPYHWHEEVEILHVLSGVFRLSVDEEQFTLRAGDVCYIAAGRLHGGAPEDCVYECIVFDMRLLLKGSGACREMIASVVSRQVDIQPYFPHPSPVTLHTVPPMFEALREGSAGDRLITLGCLYQFVGAVYKHGAYTRRSASSSPDVHRVLKLKQVFELIERRLDCPPTLTELSACAGMSPKYFCRFFKAATHRTPMDYIGFYRVEQACYEMAATDKNVTEVALDLGYSDVNYFIRCFKKYKGVTPKQYLLHIRQAP